MPPAILEMTYFEEDGGEVVPELRLRIGGEDNNGIVGYVKLSEGPSDCEEEQAIGVVAEPSSPRTEGCLWKWFKLVVLCIFLALLAAVFIKWVGPFFMDKVDFCSIKLIAFCGNRLIVVLELNNWVFCVMGFCSITVWLGFLWVELKFMEKSHLFTCIFFFFGCFYNVCKWPRMSNYVSFEFRL